MSHNVSRYRLQ